MEKQEQGEGMFGYAYVRDGWREYRCVAYKDGRIELHPDSELTVDEIRAHFEQEGITI